MNKKHLICLPWRAIIGTALLFAALAAPMAQAQNDDESETFELSPFVVESNDDIGYLAQNTLAGTRLNTSLKDTGAAISVLTKELLNDLGATSMKDVILFSNNSVPEFGDSAPNYNGNPTVGNEQWQLRIRGLPADYARNYFTWETSSDFFNVERVDQARGPNAILFGFGPAGGVVNTTTKKASLTPIRNSVTGTVGSWNRLRGALDWNQVLGKDKFALRVNLMDESGDSWREFEFYDAFRAHLAGTLKVTENSTLRGEIEYGDVQDNVTRTWLAIDQAWKWREDGRPTYDGQVWDWPDSQFITQTWSPHIVYVANDDSVLNWQGMPYAYYANQSWAHLEMTEENLAIIPRTSNTAGPGAIRDTDYVTYTVNYELAVTEDFNIELAINHQENDFRGYDSASGQMVRYGSLGESSSIWGDASNWLPTWAANPYAGRLYVENNWTRRTNSVDINNYRITAAYDLDLGKLGLHRFAGMYQRSDREYLNLEEAEVWLGAQFGESWDSDRLKAEFDSNRVFRRNYFEEGNASDIHVPSWETPLTYSDASGTYESGWVPNQEINNSDQTQDTYMIAVQSFFFSDKLVTTLGYRKDKLDYASDGSARDANGVYILDPSNVTQTDFDADTMSIGAVFHLTDWISIFANTSNSRQLPNVNQRIIGMEFPPLSEGTGTDFGVKLDLLENKVYATINYYTTDFDDATEWGNVGDAIAIRNNTYLTSFMDNGLITNAEREARWLDANGYLLDRKSEGWEFEVIANPTPNWRITANFSINEVVKDNIMDEVVAWSEEAFPYWLSVGGPDYSLSGADWDTLSNYIGWTQDYIDQETAFNGKQARGERRYGASLYTRYYFTDGFIDGFSIGGGLRYQSPNAITYVGDELIEGESLFLADFVMGYDFDLNVGSKPITVSLQLNISNLFDTDKDQLYTVAWWDPTRAERIGLQEPRRYTFSATVWF